MLKKNYGNFIGGIEGGSIMEKNIYEIAITNYGKLERNIYPSKVVAKEDNRGYKYEEYFTKIDETMKACGSHYITTGDLDMIVYERAGGYPRPTKNYCAYFLSLSENNPKLESEMIIGVRKYVENKLLYFNKIKAGLDIR